MHLHEATERKESVKAIQLAVPETEKDDIMVRDIQRNPKGSLFSITRKATRIFFYKKVQKG